MCERWVGNWTNCNILTPSSFVFSSTSFSFCWAAQPGSWGPKTLCWVLVISTVFYLRLDWLQLTELPVAPGYIIVWHPPASCERRICTQIQPIHSQGYTLIYSTGCTCSLIDGLVEGQYVTFVECGVPFHLHSYQVHSGLEW